MSELKKCLRELEIAMSFKNKNDRNAILKYLSTKKCIFNAIREISLNIEKMKLNAAQQRKLIPHIKLIKAFRRGVTNQRRQQRLVQQSGGFLPALVKGALLLLPTIISAITSK